MQKAKSLWVAYILWLFGLHYLYLGKPLNLVFYWLTAWGLGIWALLDLFRMPRLIEGLNPKSPESLDTPSPAIATTELPRKLPLPSKELQVDYGERLRQSVEEAIREVEAAKTLVERHYALTGLVQAAYRARRVDPKYAELAHKAAWETVDIAQQVATALKREAQNGLATFPVGHEGYLRLAIDLGKSGDYDRCIELCLKARREGWRGDWEHRIARCLEKKQREGRSTS